MQLPRFCIVGARPVKAIRTPEGGMDVLAYDWQTGEFKREMNYMTRVVAPDEEVDVVSEAEFDAAVKALRARLS
ncbi:MAG: hypothetical protein ACE366_24385 [Bradymonadia bacterium]